MAKFSESIKKQINSKNDNEYNLKIQSLNKEIEELKEKAGSQNTFYLKLEDIKLINNIRSHIDQLGIEELEESIKSNGQLQPVLVTKDNYLIAGYRRYTALKKSGKPEILVHFYNKNYDEIKDEVKFLQFDENEKRKSLDNIDISILFNDCLKEGYTQTEICEIFKKAKSFVSSVVRIQNLHKTLIDYIREFQTYAFSYKKFTAINSSEDIEENNFYLKNRGIIGWKTLYNIAKHESLEAQKKAFLDTFKSRLSEEELKGKFFKGIYSESNKQNTKYDKAVKGFDSLKNILDEISKSNDLDISEVKEYLLKAEEILKKQLNSEK